MNTAQRRSTAFGMALALAAPAAALPCRDAYQPDFQSTWEVGRGDWDAACGRGHAAADILAAARLRFIERCLKDVKGSVEAGLLGADEARRLCGKGAPGRDLIPKPEAGRAGTGLADVSEGLGRGLLKLEAASERIGSALASDTASLFGDKTRVVDGPGGVDAAVKPEPGGKPAAEKAAGKGLKVEPVADIPYEPADPRRAAYLKTLDRRFNTDGGSSEAARLARSMYRKTLESMDPDVLKRLVDQKVHLVLIPQNKKLTEVPPFTSLKGKKTFDKRPWDEVRGVSDVAMPGGGTATAIAEENFLDKPTRHSGHPKGFLVLHEFFGHAVQDYGLPRDPPPSAGWAGDILAAINGPPPSQSGIEAIYKESVKRKGKTGLGKYADTSKWEFFAQAAAAYIGIGGHSGNTAETVKKTNPKLYLLLGQIYGPPGMWRAKK